MKIKLIAEKAISGQGQRSNNEDNFGFISGETYTVCDGVGGANKGELASDFTVRGIISEFQRNPNSSAQLAVRKIEERITNYQATHSDASGMATTLTLVQNRGDSIYVAWCGDSRVYQFRNGKIIFKTKDHSWVNEAVAAGIISEEEAIDHPKSNIITRAIQGNDKHAEIDERILTNVQSGDCFLLCSDGILEAWSDLELEALFEQVSEPALALQLVNEHCLNKSKDNFTAICFKAEVSGQPPLRKGNKYQGSEKPKTNPNQDSFNKKTLVKKRLIIILFLLIAGVVGWLGYKYVFTKSTTPDSKPQNKKPIQKVKSIAPPPKQATPNSLNKSPK